MRQFSTTAWPAPKSGDWGGLIPGTTRGALTGGGGVVVHHALHQKLFSHLYTLCTKMYGNVHTAIWLLDTCTFPASKLCLTRTVQFKYWVGIFYSISRSAPLPPCCVVQGRNRVMKGWIAATRRSHKNTTMLWLVSHHTQIPTVYMYITVLHNRSHSTD